MKCRSVFGLSIVPLILAFWPPGLISARGGMAFAQAVSSPPKPVFTLRAQAEQGAEVANIPPAGPNIGWRLVGTAVTGDPSESFAIMEYKSTGRQGAFREGDQLGEIRIKKILPDSIVIETGQGEEMLSVSTGTRGNGTPPPQRGALLERREVDSRYGNYMQFMSEIGVRPHLEGGRPSGLLIYNIRPDSIFSRIGLENGDVIMAVNGRPITTTRQATVFYQALKSGGLILLRIKRGENIQDLRFEIR
jgi:general secretion pathway protein C